MKTRILGLAVLAVLAGCAETSQQPISEEMFTTGPAGASAPAGGSGETDPALAMVEEDPYGTIEQGGADGLTERLPDTCKLENYQQYRGMTAAEIQALGLTVPYRVVDPNAIVTQEYNPMRVNFYTNRSGRVSQISCG